ncbi:flagellar hook-basal body protein [Acidicapsa ligni]|uniref:flagellar hook-basal body protein n=1 Tax=Acidicapsa ligni TaxID=542300 RepID=UPI0021E072B0|nr:flagellar hook basal-body protein [Acidicapsa ligni]
MDSGYYAAFAGLVARTQALDTAASNLANAQTAGYRAEREYFRSVLLDPLQGNSQLGQTVNNFGVLGGDHLDMGQGVLTPTGNALDLAIEGQGFFAIETPGGVRYTRDGSFHRGRDGRLVTAAGELVLSSQRQPIPVPPGAVSVGVDGAISVDGAIASTVGVFVFPVGTQLTPEGKNSYLPPDKVQPALSTEAIVHQGNLEAANEDAIQGSLDLLMMQRQAETMQRALTIFHTEFNKTAAEDLPRV